MPLLGSLSSTGLFSTGRLREIPLGEWKIPHPFPEVGSTCGRAAASGSLPALPSEQPYHSSMDAPTSPQCLPHQPWPSTSPSHSPTSLVGHQVGTRAEGFLLIMEKEEQTPLKSRVQALIPEPFPKMGLFYTKHSVHIPVFLRITEQCVFHR